MITILTSQSNSNCTTDGLQSSGAMVQKYLQRNLVSTCQDEVLENESPTGWSDTVPFDLFFANKCFGYGFVVLTCLFYWFLLFYTCRYWIAIHWWPYAFSRDNLTFIWCGLFWWLLCFDLIVVAAAVLLWLLFCCCCCWGCSIFCSCWCCFVVLFWCLTVPIYTNFDLPTPLVFLYRLSSHFGIIIFITMVI